MNRKTLLFLCLLLSQLTWAVTVTKEEAQQKALQFLSKHTNATDKGGRLHLPAMNRKLNLAKDASSYYVFNVGERDGFVVVSGDDRAPAILGYCDEGSFNTEDMPENMKAWLQGYADQIEWLKQHPNQAVRASELDEHEAVKPLLNCTWNQGSPYNSLCPYDGNARSVTGCVATAMAQVLYYHKYPAQTIATIPAYTTYTKGINVSSIGITTLNWTNMLSNYTGNETNEQKDAVATLMKLCGASVEMDYSSNESGAQSSLVPIAFKNYFDYDAATYLADRGNFRAREWNNLIYNELANNRPVYYSGQSTGGGHAFVIDGYDKNGLFHVNWGWGGNSNNYFLLSILDPGSNSGIGASSSTDGYSFYQDALIGAQPNTGVAPKTEVKMTTYSLNLGNESAFKLTNGVYNIYFTAEMYNLTGDTYEFEIGVGVYDSNHELVFAESCRNVELDDSWGWRATELSAEAVPALPNGHYTVCVVSRENGSSIWLKNAGSDKYYLTATVSNNTLTLQTPTINLSGIMEVSGTLEKGRLLTTKTTIQNNGTFFNEQLYLQVNGEDVGGQYFEVEEGTSDAIEMSFTPKQTGSTKLAIGYKTYYYVENEGWHEEFNEIASKTVTIAAAKNYNLSFSNGQVLNADANGIIGENRAKLRVSIKNNSTYTYDDDIRTYAWKKNGDGSTFNYAKDILTPISIAAGATKTVDIVVDELDNGIYWFILVYKNNGEFTSYNNVDECYRDLYNYTIAAAASNYTVTFINGAKWQNVYAYTFNPEKNGSWPGELIQKTGTQTINGENYEVYTYTLASEEAPGYIIFNNGNGGDGNQTEDLVFENGTVYSYDVADTPNPGPSMTGDGTLNNPYTVTDAITVAGKLAANVKSTEKYFIKGTISKIRYSFSEQYGTAVFYISDDGSTSSDQFQIYNAYYLENKPWIEGNVQIQVGDEVIMHGYVTNYNGTTPETVAKEAYIYSLNGKTKEELEDGTYYLRNVSTGKFWGAANKWGTQASLVDEYQYATLSNLGNGTYKLQSMVSNGGNTIYFNGEWMDSGDIMPLTITKTNDGLYTISNGNNYFGYDGTSTLLAKNLTADDKKALWRIMTENEIMEEQQAILATATADHPVDATFLIRDADFGRNRTDWNQAWSLSNCNNWYIGGPGLDITNYCAESYHSTFYLDQYIYDAPNGVYRLQAQGFFRQDGSDNEDLPYFFIEGDENRETAQFPLLTGTENSMEDAAMSFQNGEYNCTPMFVEAGNWGLTVGAYLNSNVMLWCTWDNFRLTYYGSEANVNDVKNASLITEYEAALAAARALLTDKEYIIVTGTERNDLSNTINTYSNVEHATDALNEAIDELTNAVTTFKLAKLSYEKLAYLQQFTGTFPYASTQKTAIVEAHKDYKPTSAADAETKYEEWILDYRSYAESSALLESKAESTNLTYLIHNPNAEEGTDYWTLERMGSVGYIQILNNEPLTDANGNSDYSYFDGGAWNIEGWDVTLYQYITLQPGNYLLTVTSRASGGLSSFTLFADEKTTEMAHIGSVGGLFNNGWNDASVEFEIAEESTIKIGVRGVTEHIQNWMSFTRFRLMSFPSSATTGITETNNEMSEKDYYDLQGRKVNTSTKGLYIVRKADGSNKKTLVK